MGREIRILATLFQMYLLLGVSASARAAEIVSILSPASDMIYNLNEVIQVSVNINTAESIKRVVLYRDQQIVAIKASAPYVFSVQDTAGGTHHFSAVATSTLNKNYFSKTVKFVVNDFSYCNNKTEDINGSLCAVQPSLTDPAIQDKILNSYGQPIDGLGFHAIGLPKNLNQLNGVLVYFVGTFGRPYDFQNGHFSDKNILIEGISKNFLVVQVAYNNTKPVNTVCGEGAGFNDDNCAGKIREETLTGVNRSSFVSVDVANSIDNRLQKLIQYLELKGLPLPVGFSSSTFTWAGLRVGGHSQGGGHAYYIAKNRGVSRACLLASPFDPMDSKNFSGQPIADWFKASVQATHSTKIRAVLSVYDTSYEMFSFAHSFMGLNSSQVSLIPALYFVNDDGVLKANGHVATVKAPEFADERTAACFE